MGCSVTAPAPVATGEARAAGEARTAGAAMIEVDGLRVRFGELEAVADVSFAVAAGGSFGIVGESGSGKSTLLRVLSGLNRDDWTGRVAFAGEPVGKQRDKRFLSLIHI